MNGSAIFSTTTLRFTGSVQDPVNTFTKVPYLRALYEATYCYTMDVMSSPRWIRDICATCDMFHRAVHVQGLNNTSQVPKISVPQSEYVERSSTTLCIMWSESTTRLGSSGVSDSVSCFKMRLVPTTTPPTIRGGLLVHRSY